MKFKALKHERNDDRLLWGRRCLIGIDFSSLCPWDAQPQIQRNHFARGECGWANWLLVPCGSPRCEEQKSRARSGVGRPRQDRLGAHAVTTSVPQRQTLHLIISPPETLQNPMDAGGRVRAQGSSFRSGAWMCAAASLNATRKSARCLTICTRLS